MGIPPSRGRPGDGRRAEYGFERQGFHLDGSRECGRAVAPGRDRLDARGPDPRPPSPGSANNVLSSTPVAGDARQRVVTVLRMPLTSFGLQVLSGRQSPCISPARLRSVIIRLEAVVRLLWPTCRTRWRRRSFSKVVALSELAPLFRIELYGQLGMIAAERAGPERQMPPCWVGSQLSINVLNLSIWMRRQRNAPTPRNALTMM